MAEPVSESYRYLTRQRIRASRYANLFPYIPEFSLQFRWWTDIHRGIEDRKADAALRDLRQDSEEPRAPHPAALTHDRTD